MNLHVLTGPGNHDHILFKQLKKHRFTYYFSKYWPNYELGYSDEQGLEVVFHSSTLYKATSYIAYGVWNKLSYFKKFNWHQTIIFSLFDYLASSDLKKVDVLLGWSQMSLKSIEKVKEAGGVSILEHPMPHVHTWLKIKDEYAKFNLSVDTCYSIFPDAIVKKMLKEYEEADYINVLSTYCIKSFVENGVPFEKLKLTPLGIDTEFFRPAETKQRAKSGKFQVLCVCRIEVWKGIQYLLEAIDELNIEDIELVLAGRLLPEMEPFFKKYKGRYTYLGAKSKEELVRIYQQAHVFVLPSIMEAFGLVILEAMACGLPVVVTENSCGPDVVKDGQEGFVVPVCDTEALKSKIMYLYQNRNLCCEMGIAARARVVEKYTNDLYGERMVDLLREVNR